MLPASSLGYVIIRTPRISFGNFWGFYLIIVNLINFKGIMLLRLYMTSLNVQ